MHSLNLSGKKKGNWSRLIFLSIRLGLCHKNVKHIFMQRYNNYYVIHNNVNYLYKFLSLFLPGSSASHPGETSVRCLPSTSSGVVVTSSSSSWSISVLTFLSFCNFTHRSSISLQNHMSVLLLLPAKILNDIVWHLGGRMQLDKYRPVFQEGCWIGPQISETWHIVVVGAKRIILISQVEHVECVGKIQRKMIQKRDKKNVISAQENQKRMVFE